MKNIRHLFNLKINTYVIFTLFIIYLSTAKPTGEGSKFLEFFNKLNIPHIDKVLHLGTYTLHCAYSSIVFKNFLFAVSTSFGLSLIIEVIQFYLPFRSFEFADLVANLTGCLFGILIIKQFLKDPARQKIH